VCPPIWNIHFDSSSGTPSEKIGRSARARATGPSRVDRSPGLILGSRPGTGLIPQRSLAHGNYVRVPQLGQFGGPFGEGFGSHITRCNWERTVVARRCMPVPFPRPAEGNGTCTSTGTHRAKSKLARARNARACRCVLLHPVHEHAAACTGRRAPTHTFPFSFAVCPSGPAGARRFTGLRMPVGAHVPDFGRSTPQLAAAQDTTGMHPTVFNSQTCTDQEKGACPFMARCMPDWHCQCISCIGMHRHASAKIHWHAPPCVPVHACARRFARKESVRRCTEVHQ
jgi:hypothetical protein